MWYGPKNQISSDGFVDTKLSPASFLALKKKKWYNSQYLKITHVLPFVIPTSSHNSSSCIILRYVEIQHKYTLTKYQEDGQL